MQSVLPTTNPMAATDLPPYNYDVDKAKSLLQEAGFKGMTADISVSKGMLPKQEEISQAIAAGLAPLGFNLTVNVMDAQAVVSAQAFQTSSTWRCRGRGFATMPHPTVWSTMMSSAAAAYALLRTRSRAMSRRRPVKGALATFGSERLRRQPCVRRPTVAAS